MTEQGGGEGDGESLSGDQAGVGRGGEEGVVGRHEALLPLCDGGHNHLHSQTRVN